MVPGFVDRTGGSVVGNADQEFSGNPGKPENSGTQIYGSRIRVRTGGSRWLSALPTGGSNRLRALPGEDLGRFNLWRPTVVARTGGSEWQSALPTGSADLQSAGNPADSQNSGTPIYGS